ncbi:MAG: hypothetical protein FWF44_03575, partial [Defluviitaleaceae bacterium]|nr:hypothetical protein [Defluviitaleaceae bacterium]
SARQLCKKGDVLAEIQFDQDAVNTNIKVLELQIQQENDDFAAQKDRGDTALAGLNKQLKSATDSSSRQKLDLQIARQQRDNDYASGQHGQRLADLTDQLAKEQSHLQPEQIIAPFDGIAAPATKQSAGAYGSVTQLPSFSLGQTVYAGQVVVTVYDTSKYFLQVSANSTYIRCNMPVTIEAVKNKQSSSATTSERESYTGRVVNDPKYVNPADFTSDYFIAVDQPIPIDESALNQTFVVTLVSQSVDNAVMVDTKAVVNEGGKSYVYIVEDGTEKKRYVKTGYFDPASGMTQILAGVEPGTVVALH